MADEAVQHGRLACSLHAQTDRETDQIGAHEQQEQIARGFSAEGAGPLRRADTYDVAKGDGVEERGGAARRGVVGGVVVGEERRRLAHRLGELGQLLYGLHGRRSLGRRRGQISGDRELRAAAETGPRAAPGLTRI